MLRRMEIHFVSECGAYSSPANLRRKNYWNLFEHARKTIIYLLMDLIVGRKNLWNIKQPICLENGWVIFNTLRMKHTFATIKNNDHCHLAQAINVIGLIDGVCQKEGSAVKVMKGTKKRSPVQPKSLLFSIVLQ
jgi:hypothetical protein